MNESMNEAPIENSKRSLCIKAAINKKFIMKKSKKQRKRLLDKSPFDKNTFYYNLTEDCRTFQMSFRV